MLYELKLPNNVIFKQYLQFFSTIFDLNSCYIFHYAYPKNISHTIISNFNKSNSSVMYSQTKKLHFEERFEDSEANISEVNNEQVTHQRKDVSKGQPIQLLSISSSGRIEPNEQAFKILEQYQQPIGFVSLVGKMRTGKSCLLNRLLHLTGKGFRVDPSTQSCTEGIWMWSQPEYNYATNSFVFYLDTEGTDSFSKNVQNDTKIFTLAVLISSYFIYNSVGSIDERSLSELEMITALSKQIKTDEKLNDRDNQENLYRFMPKFLWLLRDFTLKIQDERGKKISATQYLQNCLTDKDSLKVNEQSRKIKKSIMNYFKQRQCLTMVRPVGDENQLQRLNSIPDHALRREFVEGINQLRQKINKNTGPKSYEGRQLNGSMMVCLIENYIQCFNDGKVPNIKSAWESITQAEGVEAFRAAIKVYQQIFQKQFEDEHEPKGEQIHSILAKLKSQTLKQFHNHYPEHNSKSQKDLLEIIDEKQNEIIKINNQLNEERNIKILAKHNMKLKKKMLENKYGKNPLELQSDINQLKQNYNRDARGYQKGEIITDFLTNLTPILLNLKKDDDQQEISKKAKLQIQEYERRLRLKQQENQSIKRQLKANQNAANTKLSSKLPDKKGGKKQEPKSTGCCTGDKCIIM